MGGAIISDFMPRSRDRLATASDLWPRSVLAKIEICFEKPDPSINRYKPISGGVQAIEKRPKRQRQRQRQRKSVYRGIGQPPRGKLAPSIPVKASS